jgi:hypothetical protein
MNGFDIRKILPSHKLQLNVVFILGIILVTALVAFEMFNYSTTEYALTDLLGGLNFLGLKWATILTIAFCGIDFAGISRLFLVGRGNQEPSEAWYLFGAWMLCGTMNAILTWWGVSMAVVSHPVQSNTIMDPGTITKVIPVFVALMVWVIRVMAIGTVATAGSNLFRNPTRHTVSSIPIRRKVTFGEGPANSLGRPVVQPLTRLNSPVRPSGTVTRPSSSPAPRKEISEPAKEPTYQKMP